MRRNRKLKNFIIDDDTGGPSHPGRSDTLVARRNKCLLSRYFFYARYRHKAFDNILDLLKDEFFLSKDRITRIILTNRAFMQVLKENEVSCYQLQSAWPQYKW